MMAPRRNKKFGALVSLGHDIDLLDSGWVLPRQDQAFLFSKAEEAAGRNQLDQRIHHNQQIIERT